VASALRDAGIDLSALNLLRAVGGRSQLYRATTTSGGTAFVKVYSRDTRDADLLYRGYRTLLLRGPNDDWPSSSLDDDVRREAFLLLLDESAGVSAPHLEALATLPDGSVALAMSDVGGEPLDSLPSDQIDRPLMEAVWRQVDLMAKARIAHRALRAGNILVADGKPVIIDVGFGAQSASARLLSIDRAELLASSGALVGPEAAVAAAATVVAPDDLASAAPYLQPLALTATTRKHASKSLLRSMREQIATVTEREPAPLARLVRVRPKTLVTIAALAGAFYVLLPQLANVGDSFRALRSANVWWMLACIALSGLTYVAGAVALRGSVIEHLPLGSTIETQMASSFVNRVTPANVGGMALNVRFMQKAGVDPAEAVTGIGLNVVAGVIVHVMLLFLFFAWAGQSSNGFQLPASSKVLAVLAVVMAIVGLVIATRRGRRLAKKYVLGFVQRSRSSVVGIMRSPSRLAVLFGGSLGVTMAYICSLAAAVSAFPNQVTFAEIGAVYLGASLIAAAAPTPGGLGAMEAALVAGFTAIGMDPGTAVAAVLSYRLATYWLPVLPGWLSFHHLENRNLI
jgi:undecaprenyl-diphosphatase